MTANDYANIQRMIDATVEKLSEEILSSLDSAETALCQEIEDVASSLRDELGAEIQDVERYAERLEQEMEDSL